MSREKLKTSKRIVVKVGTGILTDKEGNLDMKYIDNITGQISKLIDKSKEVILVTSGAVGAGKKELNIKGKIRDLKLIQSTAAVGQSLLMNYYHTAFAKNKKKVAQILITYNSFFNRKQYLNLKNSVETLLKMDVIPIINENDPIATDELGGSFGDNDKLSALVASKINAEALIMLTDIDGLCDKDPRTNKDALVIKEVNNIDKEIEKCAGKTSSLVSKGGMKTKIEAAKITMDSGCILVIANGKEKNILDKVLTGKDYGTIFIPSSKLDSKKRWILHAPVRGKIIVDKGAKNAMEKGKNLLPAGVNDIQGSFSKNAVVEIVCEGKVLGKAISDFNSDDLKKIKGKKSESIKKILGKESYTNVFRGENFILR